jgi:hypothetical protein
VCVYVVYVFSDNGCHWGSSMVMPNKGSMGFNRVKSKTK